MLFLYYTIDIFQIFSFCEIFVFLLLFMTSLTQNNYQKSWDKLWNCSCAHCKCRYMWGKPTEWRYSAIVMRQTSSEKLQKGISWHLQSRQQLQGPLQVNPRFHMAIWIIEIDNKTINLSSLVGLFTRSSDFAKLLSLLVVKTLLKEFQLPLRT